MQKIEIKKLKKGSFVLIDDEVYQVENVQTAVTSKHGSAKTRMEAKAVFGRQKKTIVKPADTKMTVPIIQKKTAQVLSITGDTAQLMDMEDYSTFDAAIPEELREKIKEGREVLIWKFGDKVLIKETR